LLKIVALEPLHAWAISQRLKQISGEVLQVSDGSLYPALHKLEQEGWIKAEWKITENGRRAKFYSLTRPGRRALQRETANWERLAWIPTEGLRPNKIAQARRCCEGRMLVFALNTTAAIQRRTGAVSDPARVPRLRFSRSLLQ